MTPLRDRPFDTFLAFWFGLFAASSLVSTLHVGRRMQHDWPLTLPWLDESRDAWSSIAAFVGRKTRRDLPPTAHSH